MSIEQCIICGSSDTSVFVHLHSNDLLALKCKNCSHIFINNSPINADNISEYYTMEDFKGKRTLQEFEYSNYYTDCFVDYNQRNESSLVLMQFKEKANYFDSLLPKGSKILDVGCATGVFLDMMRKFEWEVEGVEVSNELASYAHEKFDIQVHVKDLTKEKLDSGPFQLITMFDVIEHIPDPNLMIKACSDLLVENGLLLLRTPTEEALLRDIAKGLYLTTLKKIDFPMLWFYSYEHLHSFSTNSLKNLLVNHGFEVTKVFREEESFDRLNISPILKTFLNFVNIISSWTNKQHKISLVAKKIY
ncbi:uncharacterized protein METZ01_LOCUS182489 [marine metagenome]|uniref:Methyltransferase type 11 domain-containing protein n=1 Tax=marine metagenome TaxID=408172 RepID=A0A382CU64_9ZZZZ